MRDLLVLIICLVLTENSLAQNKLKVGVMLKKVFSNGQGKNLVVNTMVS